MVSKRRNDDRDYRRRVPRRTPKFRILVVCEGEVTEPEYLRSFQHHVRNRRVHVELPDEPGVPLTVVSTAIRLAHEAAEDAHREEDDNLRFDSVWAVVDVDAHPNLPQAKELAQRSGISLAISNPCFELWALLHFEDHRAHIERHTLASRVREHCPGYAKKLPFDKIILGYSDAVARARDLRKEAELHGTPGRNPTTDVVDLTELIRTQ